MQNFSDFIMKCAIFEEDSSSCVVYSRFSGTLFPVSMIDGDHTLQHTNSITNPLLAQINETLRQTVASCTNILAGEGGGL